MEIEVIWEQLVDRGLEHLVLRQSSRIEARGLALGILDGAPYRIQYQIICDAGWNVQSLNASNLLDGTGFALTRHADKWLDGRNHPVEALRGCTDVDIMVTPFTNTLPIKRLNLSAGEWKEISVVYVRAPDLALSRFDQRYTCISNDAGGGVYKYESLKNGYTADLKIDEDGLVTDYPGIFKLHWKKKGSESATML